jgi:hypothetical protein
MNAHWAYLCESFLIVFLCSFLFNEGLSQDIKSSELLTRSIAYHDPYQALMQGECEFHFRETRPGGKDRYTTVKFGVDLNSYTMKREVDEGTLDMGMTKGNSYFLLNGSKEISAELVEKYRLNNEWNIFLRNYYHYLWYLPMKLNDAGTIIQDEVLNKEFMGNKSLALRVTYEAEVGDDIWYFYFHPESYAMIGYQFYHDEEDNDGEYILLENEIQVGSVRLPKSRTWYTNKEDKLLGTDHLEKLIIK